MKTIRVKKFIIGIFFYSISLPVFSQSNARVKTVIPVDDTTQIDTVSIVPGSEVLLAYLNGEIIQASAFKAEIDYANALLILRNNYLPDSIELSYKVFPYLLTQKYFNKNPQDLEKAELILKPDRKSVV